MNFENARLLSVKVLNKMFEREGKEYEELRIQLENSSLKISELNDAGFFAELTQKKSIKNSLPKVENISQIGDVIVDDSIKDADKLGFVLFIEDGIISLLDVYFMDLPEQFDVKNIKLEFDD